MQLTGQLFDYVIVFWAGVVVSFTPCVYPLIPITAGIIAGANTQGTKARGFFLSSMYVLGIAISYCVFGVIAALTGKVFGQFLNHPAIFLLVGIVLLVFALILFEKIPLRVFGATAQPRIVARNAGTVLLLGIASGLVIGPCTAPILGTLLLYVASKQNLIHAVSLLFVFSYGVGASLIIVGTGSGFVSRLPRSGPWLLRIKYLCGGVLVLAAVFFIVKAGVLLSQRM